MARSVMDDTSKRIHDGRKGEADSDGGDYRHLSPATAPSVGLRPSKAGSGRLGARPASNRPAYAARAANCDGSQGRGGAHPDAGSPPTRRCTEYSCLWCSR
ncbi:unnamed protein product [Urochloa humidicola]